MLSDLEKIRSIISEEIKRFLNELEAKHPTITNPGTADVLFLLSSQPDKDLKTAAAVSTISEKFSCALVWTESPHEPLSPPLSRLPQLPEPQIPQAQRQILDNLKCIIIFEPTLSLLANVALGTTDDFPSRLTFQFLAYGKPVYAVRGSEQTAPGTSNRQIQVLSRGYERTLEEWGMLWLRPEQLFSTLEVLLEAPAQNQASVSEKTNSQRRLIVTGEDVEEHIRSGQKQWILPPDAIVTAIAREIAERNGFVLKRPND